MLKYYQHCLQALIQSIQRSAVTIIFLKSWNSNQIGLVITMNVLELTDVQFTQC